MRLLGGGCAFGEGYVLMKDELLKVEGGKRERRERKKKRIDIPDMRYERYIRFRHVGLI